MSKPLRWLLPGFVGLLLSSNVHLWAAPMQPAAPASAPATFTRSSFILPGGVIVHSSPTLADLTGDNIPEIIVGTTAQNGAEDNKPNRPIILAALKGDGSILWTVPLDAAVNSSPAVGDIDNNGQPEIVISTGGDVGDRKRRSALLAFDKTGHEIWRYNFIDHDPRDGFGDGAFSSPTLCDVEGDGDMEIAVGGWDSRFHLVDHTGQALWFNLNRWPNMPKDPGYYNTDTIWSTAACADLNADGQQEIIIGGDVTANAAGMPDGTKERKNGGFLYIFDKDGKVLVRRYFPETIYSSPAVGDLDGDGTLEIVVGTGYYWWNAQGRKATSYVYAFSTSQVFSSLPYADPAKLPDLAGWPQKTTYPGFSSPALADLDKDKALEIIIGSGEPFVQNDEIPGIGQVYAWHHTGQVVAGWPISPKNAQNRDAQIISSPVVADVDNDGELEVLFALIWDVNVYNADGSFQEYFSTLWTTASSPAVGDTDGDSKLDVWIGSSDFLGDRTSGHLWRFSSDKAGIGALPWPVFHQNAARTGLYPNPALPALAGTQLFLLRDTERPGAPNKISTVLQLVNDGGQPFDWAVGDKPTEVTVTPATGKVNPGAQSLVDVTIDTSNLKAGSHNLGKINLTATADGQALPASPLTLDVTVYVGPVNYAYLPLVEAR